MSAVITIAGRKYRRVELDAAERPSTDLGRLMQQPPISAAEQRAIREGSR